MGAEKTLKTLQCYQNSDGAEARSTTVRAHVIRIGGLGVQLALTKEQLLENNSGNPSGCYTMPLWHPEPPMLPADKEMRIALECAMRITY